LLVAPGKGQNPPHYVNREVVNLAGDFPGAASGLELAGDVLATDAMPLDAPCARQLAGDALGGVALPTRVPI
jgi:hypothetical protein